MSATLKQRLGSFLLAILMVITMIPVGIFSTSAAGDLVASDSNLGLNWTDASDSRGGAEWVVNGSNIIGNATGYRAVVTKAVTTTLTITNNHPEERILSFDYSLTGGGSVSGIITSSSGTYAETLASGESVTITLTSPKGANKTNTLSLINIQLIKEGKVASTFLTAENGSYTVDGATISAETVIEKNTTENYNLSAQASDGYMFFGWYSDAVKGYISYQSPISLKFGEDPILKPVFVADTTAIFKVGTTVFADLTEASDFASKGSEKTVVLLNDGIIYGDHTIAEGVTLLVPFNAENTLYREKPACSSSDGNNAAWVQPTAYRTLTLAENASVTVNGSISVSGKHAASNGGQPYCGAPTGPLGWINMLDGSNIVLKNGSNLYVWGYIQGSGTVVAESGATVYENFQFTDFRGGSNTLTMASEMLVFPINQYYVQNIEVPTVFHSGSAEKVYTSGYASSMMLGGAATFIGEGGMFIAEKDSYIVKDYIENRDRLQVDVYGDAQMNSMVVELSIEVNSANFTLPITNNVTINLHTGTTELNQSVALLPGTEMYIGRDATLKVGYSDVALNDYNTKGHNLIVYDYEEWTYGLDLADNYSEVEGRYAFNSLRLRPLVYVPGRTYNRTEADDIKDAVVDVNGKIEVEGYLYTTVGGAAIKSTEKTGKIEMVNGGGDSIFTFQSNQGTALGIPMNSAMLLNGDGSYYKTGPDFYEIMNDEACGTAEPGALFEYCAQHNCWFSESCRKCEGAEHFNISWNINGNVVNQEFESGSIPVYPGSTPEKAFDDYCHYIFAGWSDSENGTAIELPEVTGDAVYYALFTRASHIYSSVAEDGKHSCTGCRKPASCIDLEGDGDHICDLGCGDVKSEHMGGSADCTTQAVCTECNEAYGEKSEHTEIIIEAVQPTCSSSGLTEGKKCSVCNEIIVAQESVPATDHKYTSQITKEATCTQTGVETFTCSCGESYSEEIAKKSHKIITVSAKEATCEKTGLTEGKMCSVCKTVTVAQQKVDKKPHKYATTTTTKATLTKSGKQTTKCSVCGYVSKSTTVYYPKSIKLSTSTYTYNGKAKTPSVVVKDSKGKTLKKDTDYTVKYASGRKTPGKYTVTVTFKGKYSGTKKLTLTIEPKAPSISSLTSKTKGKAVIKWTNVTGESGYQLYFATSKNGTYKKVKSYEVNKTAGSKSGLKSKKTYYFKVRAYKKTSGGTVYSSWSAVKRVKIK